MTLFEECLNALGKQKEILSKEKTVSLFENLEKRFPMLISGHIDWRYVDNKVEIENIFDLLNFLGEENRDTFIFWDNVQVPGIKTTLEAALHVIDDVTAVGFYTWLFSSSFNYVVEFGNSNIVLGFSTDKEIIV